MNECIFDIDPKLLSLAAEAENECREMFEKIDSNAEYNGQKVLKAFIDNRVSEGCLKGTTGYGYGDMGRDTIDKVFAQALGGEDALVRHTFVNGTHALSTALFGVLRSGDTMLACTGKPYDTLEEIIGIRGEKGSGSLIDFSVKYEQVDLVDEMYPDYDEIAKKAVGAKIAYIQRSRGYSLRPSLTVEIIGKIVVCKQVADVHTNIWAQMLAYNFMKDNDIEAHLASLRVIYKHKLELMIEQIEKNFSSQIKFTRPEGGLFIWCTLPEGSDMTGFCKKAVAEYKVAVVPGNAFMVSESDKTASFRLNFSTPTDKQIIDGCEKLGKLSKEMFGD